MTDADPLIAHSLPVFVRDIDDHLDPAQMPRQG
jgi:hypothetical protein